MEDLDEPDWHRYCNGETEALGRIYDRHKDRLFTYCLHVTRQRAASEDIVQEVFAKLIAQRTKMIQVVSIKNWLFVCARNLAFNHLSHQKHETALLNEPWETVTYPDPETKRFVQNVLSKLDSDERDLIILREHQLFSTADLAGMLGVSEEAVRVRLYRIRKKMQALAKEWL